MVTPTSPFNPFFPTLHRRLGGDEYAIEGDLAKGAVWRTFKARRVSDNKYVAVKEAPCVDVRQEIDILNRCIDRTNIVRLIKSCRDDDEDNGSKTPIYTYLIIELCSTDLNTFQRDLGGRLPRNRLRVAAKHLADGYDHLRANRILHKNISSKNILVYLVGNRVTLKISGFNCAVIMEEKSSFLKRSLPITGRVQYMAPEIGRGFVKSKRHTTEYSSKSDLWSLGILLYEMAFGKFPFTSAELLDLFKMVSSPRKQHQQQQSMIKFEDLLDSSDTSTYCSLVSALLRVNPDERMDPLRLRSDPCFRQGFGAVEEEAEAIFIDDQFINEPIRSYDLSWALPAAVTWTRVGDYQYNEAIELGKGSFGKVWRAKRVSDGAKVALKRVHKEDIDLAEIETMQTVVHPNLLKMIDHFEQYPYVYIITELCSWDLGNFLKSSWFPDGKLRDESDAKVLSRHLSSGYMAMKSADILHRDIKPGNVLVSIDPEHGGATFKLADFGCSKAMTHVEYAQTVLGTPFYMAPELGACLYLQIENAHYDHRADIWSMGLIVFQSVSGRLPFSEGDLLRLCYDVGTGQSTEYYQNDLHLQTTTMMNASRQFQQLLAGALCADYDKRMTAADFFQHPFHSHLPLSSRLHAPA